MIIFLKNYATFYDDIKFFLRWKLFILFSHQTTSEKNEPRFFSLQQDAHAYLFLKKTYILFKGLRD